MQNNPKGDVPTATHLDKGRFFSYFVVSVFLWLSTVGWTALASIPGKSGRIGDLLVAGVCAVAMMLAITWCSAAYTKGVFEEAAIGKMQTLVICCLSVFSSLTLGVFLSYLVPR